MCNVLQHRGPDAEGFFFQNKTGLGHRRLSIIDLSAAANQPMYSSDGDWVIILNGEIYNYREIKKELIEKGCVFKTNSDTEVILQSFQLFGAEAVNRFIGMFSFAIYHLSADALYIFRDRVGVKPLYYYCNNGDFYFASELKALIPLLPVKEINAEALTDFFRFGYIRNPNSIFKNVFKLPSGHYATVKNKELVITKYWNIADKVKKQDHVNEEEAAIQLESLMQSSFDYRMVADVPVGVFLSGGVDSSAVTALLSRSHSNLKTFSVGFDDDRYNEAGYAKTIANYLGTDHHEQILDASDAERVLDQYFSIYDEPFADSSGIPVYLICQFAKENGCKVVLSADGGDELFGGYERYSDIPKIYNRINKRKSLHGVLHSGLKAISGIPVHKKNWQHKVNKFSDLLDTASKEEMDFYTSYLSINSKYNLRKLLKGNDVIPAEKKYGHRSLEEKMMLWDFENYLSDDLLAKVDRASMATSIEAREPFLDHRLVEFVFSLPLSVRKREGQTKYLLKKVLYKYIPQEYFNRKKMGFSIPLFQWFSKKLDKEFEMVFSKDVLSQIYVLDTKVVLAEYKKYLYFKKQGKEHNILFIWHLYVFIKWWLKWM